MATTFQLMDTEKIISSYIQKGLSSTQEILNKASFSQDR